MVQAPNIMVNDSHVTVTWEPPTNPNGVVNYSVTLMGINLLDNSSVLDSTTVDITATTHIIEHISIPYSLYTAQVVPHTSAGNGPSNSATSTTPEAGNSHKTTCG